MRIIEAEIDLRDETRGVERSREALQRDEYVSRATGLSKIQDDLHSRLKNVIVDIQTLPESAANFAKELKTIAAAVAVMAETTQILSRPETGSDAIAAETEVIELLLQAKRANPKGGGAEVPHLAAVAPVTQTSPHWRCMEPVLTCRLRWNTEV
ncbi:MAG: hypothetical protein GY903_16795 [Fuerstiella sp.]|nr:hypothetical protein [Fuerstiella sp.]MCP4856142.1 hypothetical protein [Fuerstiella sp.]